MSVLAIDQGTTSTRAILVDAAASTRVVASRPNPATHPRPGWVEQDAVRLLDDVRRCLEAGAAASVAIASDGGDIEAVGLDNQGESCLAWDAHDGRPLYPVISWQDERTRNVVVRLASDGLAEMVRERTGLPLDPYFSASKMAWIVREIPEARRLAAQGRLRLGTTDAWFRDRLTGRFETDATTASRTSLMNLASGSWDEELCIVFGVPANALPTIVPSTGDLGALRVGGRLVPLASSLVDQQASLYGHGCHSEGDTKMTFGTGAFASTLVGNRIPASGLDGEGPLPTVAWRKVGENAVYALDGGVHSAGSAVAWAREQGIADAISGLGAALTTPAVVRGLVFVPALAGLGCPHWDRRARGAWMGLGPTTTREDMALALLEGIALRMAEVLRSIERHHAVKSPISVDGGMTANPVFLRFLSSALQRELQVSEEPELTALGTALLAAEAVGRPIQREFSGQSVIGEPLPAAAFETFEAAREAVARFGATVPPAQAG